MSIDTATGKEAPAEISSKRVKETFAQIAKNYERFNAVSSFGMYKSWLRHLVDSVEVHKDTKVVDIAGGTGDVTFAMAKRRRPQSVLCTDLVEEMLDVAKEHYKEGKAQGVEVSFGVVDAQDMPLDDDSFDVLTVAYGIRNMPDRSKALSEMYRVLKPGGQFACLEFSHGKSKLFGALYRFYLHHMIPFWGKLVAGQKEGFVYLSDSIEAFPNPEDFAEMIEEAGFENVAWKTYTFGIVAIHTAVKPHV
ncbi:MAG: bifunctional demethylmenaquinone methyltransferase/2-methoxy-6-polyprenyl-1,4-benzoquinol methylase UbiE [Eggerthellaceae bacterium]|nr:bifunctional demethylmenaquinone methyltransferase/2-methoxy-6-polyprenyl-1,4-benzoquinol methylase UbiE [Eggerthellaceae bacterium]